MRFRVLLEVRRPAAGVDGGYSDVAGGDFGCGMKVRILVREVE